jgi:glycyl-tRNA synthetase (class II)
MNPQVWVASGHVSTFNDPLIDCKACKMRYRADKLIEDWNGENGVADVAVEAMETTRWWPISVKRESSAPAAARPTLPTSASSISCSRRFRA